MENSGKLCTNGLCKHVHQISSSELGTDQFSYSTRRRLAGGAGPPPAGTGEGSSDKWVRIWNWSAQAGNPLKKVIPLKSPHNPRCTVANSFRNDVYRS